MIMYIICFGLGMGMGVLICLFCAMVAIEHQTKRKHKAAG